MTEPKSHAERLHAIAVAGLEAAAGKSAKVLRRAVADYDSATERLRDERTIERMLRARTHRWPGT